jgi:hypothetical protein
MRRTNFSGTSSQMATADIGTEDTSISNATIDNSTYSYFIQAGDRISGTFSGGDMIYGAKITYTTDYT